MSDPVLHCIARLRVIPVVTLEDAVHARPLADALCGGGLPLAEITLRTPAGLAAIQSIAALGNVTVGAGTVLNAEQCREAIFAGAQFVVSPGLDEGVLEVCRERDVACFPGIATATEMQRAFNLGVPIVKFFPAEAMGGVPAIRSLSAPFPGMQFIPTGGIDQDNANRYLDLPPVLAIGGSWMVKSSFYAGGDFQEVTRQASKALSLVGQAEIRHIE